MGRFLLIGLDGAEPSLVERWMDEGQLPNLAALRARGTYLPCASTIPPATFPAWTTCVTGVNPGKHGVFDFTQIADGEYAIRFSNATYRAAPAIWKVLSDAGKRVCVLGVPATYPPEAVNGIMVSGFDSPVCTAVDASFVHPASIYPEVRDWRFADFQETDIGPGWHDRALPKLLDGIATKERIATKLMAREPWDFFMLVFGESDTVAHHFWLHHDPNSPRHRPGHEHAIRRVYERLDAAVGELIRAAGDDVTIGVVSDHGFGGAGTGMVHLNNWLAENRYLTFARGGESLLKKIALRVVPERWRGAVFRRFQGLASRAESRSRFAGIDWSDTTAWSEELNYFPSIRVNLKGREPDGQVDPPDYTEFCDALCRHLEGWAPVRRAWRRDELYEGSYTNRAPDILLEFALEKGYSHSCLRSRGGPSFRRIEAHEHLGGKERGMNGNHRPIGVLFLSQPCAATDSSLLDVAPTVYAAMDVAGPSMDGSSLLGETRERAEEATTPQARVYTPEEEAAIEARLRNLGYFE
jgi:predicted AlkP superfamily phosphohydrolase/phosphomutase